MCTIKRAIAYALLISVFFGCAETSNGLESPHIQEATVSTGISTGIEVVAKNEEVTTQTLDDAPEPRGWLRLATGNLAIPDPVMFGTSNATNLMLREIYTGLTRLNNDAETRVEGDLAERFVSREGGRLYEFVLRRDLKFSDGSPVTASDVKWSWERALMQNVPVANLTSVFGGIVGAQDVIDGTASDLIGVKAVDDRTLTIELQKPLAHFPMLVAQPIASVLRRENVESWGVNWTDWTAITPSAVQAGELPVGTGPFRVSELDFLTRYTLVANEHYREGSPSLGGIEFIVENEDAQIDELLAIERGDLDVVRIDEIVAKSVEDIGWNARTIRFERPPGLGYVAFNAGIAPYEDTDFRRALATAYGQPEVPGLIPLEISGGSDEFEPLTSGLSALELLQRSQYGDSVDEIELVFHEWVQGQWLSQWNKLEGRWQTELGLQSEYSVIDPSSYADMLQRGEIEIVIELLEATYPDPHTILGEFGSMFGFGTSSQAESFQPLRSMIDEASGEADLVKRANLYANIDRYIINQGLAIPIFWTSSDRYYVLQPWIHGFNHPMWGGSKFKDVSFDETYPR